VKEYYVISVAHTLREHRYITLWRPDDCGYCYRTISAGKYAEARVMSHLGYYNSGCSNIAVPVDIVDAMARPGNPRDFDGITLQMPVAVLLAVPNTGDNWRELILNTIEPPAYKVQPEYPGARRRKGE